MSLHPEFLKWVDSQAIHAVTLVEVAPRPEVPSTDRIVHPDTPKVDITAEQIIGPIVRTQMDGDGSPVSWVLAEKDKDPIGFGEVGYREVQKLAERIWKRKEIRDKFSFATVSDRLMRWAVEAASAQDVEAFSIRLERLLTELVVRRSVWLPIDWLGFEGELRFGDAVIAPLSRDEFERSLSDNNVDVSRPMFEKMRTEWIGAMVIRFEFEAEAARAIEMGKQKANDYLALLQFYALPSITLSFASHVAPRGTQPYRSEDILIFGGGAYSRRRMVSEKPYQFDISPEYRQNMEHNCLATMSRLAVRTENEYEESLLRCLLVYGRASYQSDPTDKFLQTMTAVEMFALSGPNEPIQTIIADRIALSISSDFQSRLAIVENFKAAYAERSRGTHHGKSIEDTEIIQRFLVNAWSFFLVGLRNVGHFETKQAFLDQIDAMKYRP